ncbi:hypothetical protein [Mycolicibacterium diernhoferi]|uniref:hypothetical protein n=2 Tax=Mycolicibacterium diernhoferi TaxID=1801 RepID=UPI001F21D44C|nr:hypothetical protein [Mycolicibacterium diernhoferi]
MTSMTRPVHWRDRSVMIAFALVVFAASGVAAVVMTVDRLQRGEYLTAVITFGATVFCVSSAFLTARLRFMSIPMRPDVGSAGTVLLPDSLTVGLVAAVFVSGLLAGLPYVIYVPQGAVDLSLSRGQQVFSPILIGLLVVFCLGGLIAIARRRGMGHLRLTAEGFEVVDVLFTRRGSWEDVIDVTDQTPDKNLRHPIVLVVRDAKPIVINNASGFVPNGAALYWMVRHYWLHPENRDELEDGRALDRLRNERFAVE